MRLGIDGGKPKRKEITNSMQRISILNDSLSPFDISSDGEKKKNYSIFSYIESVSHAKLFAA